VWSWLIFDVGRKKMPDEFCHSNAPDDLLVAVRDTRILQQWVKTQTDAQLSAALDVIYVHLEFQRAIVKAEIEERRHRKIEQRLEDLKKPHWTVLPNFWITVLSALAAVVAAYFAWKALKP
jgi:hypothetical protein